MPYPKQKKNFEDDKKMETITLEQALLINALPTSIREAAIKARKPRGGPATMRCLQITAKGGELSLDNEIVEVDFRDKISGGNPVGWKPKKGTDFDDKWSRSDLFVLEVVEVRLSKADRLQLARSELSKRIDEASKLETANMPLSHISKILLREPLKAMSEDGRFGIQGLEGGFSTFKLFRATHKGSEDVEENFVMFNAATGYTYRIIIESDVDSDDCNLEDAAMEQLEQLQEQQYRMRRDRNDAIKKQIWAEFDLELDPLDLSGRQ